mgnify:CR=1 FL=1
MNTEKQNITTSDVEDLALILDTVGEKVPKLIREIISSFYSQDAGRSMGQALGAFHQELVAAGIPEEEALKMTKDYLISFKSMIKDVQNTNVTKDSSQE